MEGVQFEAGLFWFDAKEPRQCPAFGTVGPLNGIGVGRARLVGSHSYSRSTGGSTTELSATDACAAGAMPVIPVKWAAPPR